MAPSATSEIVMPVGVTKQVEKQQHVHGAEDKTPLEAISHGPIVQSGEATSLLPFNPDLISFLLKSIRIWSPKQYSCHARFFLVIPPKSYHEKPILYCIFSFKGKIDSSNFLVQAFQNFHLIRNIENIFSFILPRCSVTSPGKVLQKASLAISLSGILNLGTIFG
jgi:hypothetical protein